MTFQIGPVTFDSGPTSDSIHKTGVQTAFRTEIWVDTLEEAVATEHQLLGMGTSGQPIAIVWDDDPTGWNGLYQITSVSVSPIQNYLDTGRQDVSMTVSRLPDVVQADYTFTYRDTAPTRYYVAAIHGYYTSDWTSHTEVSANDTAYSMDGTGAVNLVAPDDTTAAILMKGFTGSPATSDRVQVQQRINPSLFNIGAATLLASEQGGSLWWRVTDPNVIPDNHNIKLSNGLIRVRPDPGTQYIYVEHWSSSSASWSESARLQVYWTADGDFIRRFKIVSNTHAQVTVRCSFLYDDLLAAYVDLTIIRGSSTCWITMSSGFGGVASSGNPKLTMAEYDGSNMATTVDATYHLKRSSANSDGITPYIHSDNGTPSATTDRIAVTGPVTIARYGVGLETAQFLTNHQIVDWMVP